jgi:hypothetical protein
MAQETAVAVSIQDRRSLALRIHQSSYASDLLKVSNGFYRKPSPRPPTLIFKEAFHAP